MMVPPRRVVLRLHLGEIVSIKGTKGDLRVPFCSLFILHMANKRPDWPKKITVGSVTVKVYEVAHASNATGKAYVLAYTTPTGRKTIKFAAPSKAMDEARLQAGKLAAGKVEAADMTGGEREELFAARRIAGSVPLLAALEEWAKARDITQGQVIPAAEAWKARNRGSIENITVATALTRFLAQKKADGLQTAKNHGAQFDALRAAFGEQTLASITEPALTAYLNAIPHLVSRVTHRKRMVTFWRWAQSKKYLPQDLKTEAELTSTPKAQPFPIGIITAAAFSDLLQFTRKTEPKDLPALILAGFCGLRRSEVHGQAWRDINLAEGHVHVTAAKEGTPARRLVPLSPAAVEWLLTCPDRTSDVCEGMAIDRVRKAGIEAKFTLPENCFRHAYISHAVSKSGDIPRTSLDAGNSVAIIHKHYRSLVTKAEGEAWFAISPSAPAKGRKIIQFKNQAAS